MIQTSESLRKYDLDQESLDTEKRVGQIRRIVILSANGVRIHTEKYRYFFIQFFTS